MDCSAPCRSTRNGPENWFFPPPPPLLAFLLPLLYYPLSSSPFSYLLLSLYLTFCPFHFHPCHGTPFCLVNWKLIFPLEFLLLSILISSFPRIYPPFSLIPYHLSSSPTLNTFSYPTSIFPTFPLWPGNWFQCCHLTAWNEQDLHPCVLSVLPVSLHIFSQSVSKGLLPASPCLGVWTLSLCVSGLCESN